MSKETYDIGPKNWKEAVKIIELAIIHGTPEGRKQAAEEVRKLAVLADELPEAIAILQETRKLCSNEARLIDPEPDSDHEQYEYIDPLTQRVEAFLSKFKKS